MAKQGKLMAKLLKKMRSFGRNSNSNARGSMTTATAAVEYPGRSDSSAASDLHPVYVGKSRRRYLISSDVIHHPLLRELAERSNPSNNSDIDGDGGNSAIVVGCEVVMFEHLLWMLDNAAADEAPSESLQELVDFYAY